MNSNEFISIFSEKTGLTAEESAKILAAFDACLLQGLKKDGVVELPFGSFNVRSRSEKRGLNPITGDEIVIPAKQVVRFTGSDPFIRQL